MNMALRSIEVKVNNKISERNFIKSQLDSQAEKCKAKEFEVDELVEAKRIISEAIRLTQQQFKSFVESLVTTAISSVFPESDFKFIVDFRLEADKSQVYLLVQEGGEEPYVPEEEQGGAILDIISFALRVSMWALENPRSRNVFVIDEPFRWTGGLTTLAATMMKEITKDLGIQVIMVTHDERLIDIADRSWRVTKKGRVSVVEWLGRAVDIIKVTVRKKLNRS